MNPSNIDPSNMDPSKIRFIGYALPTAPAGVNPVGATGKMEGTYAGHANMENDVRQRVQALQSAVNVAKQNLPPDEDANSVLNVFMAPEFFFHGVMGPYVYTSDEEDPAAFTMDALKAAFPASEFPNWTFVFGTILSSQVENIQNVFSSESAQMRNRIIKALSDDSQRIYGMLQKVVEDFLNDFVQVCQAFPLVVVRDRALIVSNVVLDSPKVPAPLAARGMTTDKYFVSALDLVVVPTQETPPVITLQMANYPRIDLSDGDLKVSPFDEYSIFRQNYGPGSAVPYLDFGVEICLDHYDFRLRRNLDREPFLNKSGDIHIQLIPSSGMSISLPSVAAGADGFVFNCDGMSAFDNNVTPQISSENGLQSLYANYFGTPGSTTYAAHTQLARVKTGPVKGRPNLPDSKNATFFTLDVKSVSIIPLNAIEGHDVIFSGGPGALHLYGPYPIGEETGAP
jgi:hypothetical protein